MPTRAARPGSAAVGMGEIQFADIPQLVQFKQAYQPQPKNRAVYDEKYAVFKSIYRQMKGIYARLNSPD